MKLTFEILVSPPDPRTEAQHELEGRIGDDVDDYVIDTVNEIQDAGDDGKNYDVIVSANPHLSPQGQEVAMSRLKVALEARGMLKSES